MPGWPPPSGAILLFVLRPCPRPSLLPAIPGPGPSSSARPYGPLAPLISHLIARASLRTRRNSVGTWYVAPPTRFGRTSTSGVAFLNACWNTSKGSRFDWSRIVLNASYVIRWAVVFLPRCIIRLMNRASSSLLYLGSGATIRLSARLLLDMRIHPIPVLAGCRNPISGAPYHRHSYATHPGYQLEIMGD